MSLTTTQQPTTRRPTHTSTSRPTCRFFNTAKGCTNGSQCNFSHTSTTNTNIPEYIPQQQTLKFCEGKPEGKHCKEKTYSRFCGPCFQNVKKERELNNLYLIRRCKECNRKLRNGEWCQCVDDDYVDQVASKTVTRVEDYPSLPSQPQQNERAVKNVMSTVWTKKYEMVSPPTTAPPNSAPPLKTTTAPPTSVPQKDCVSTLTPALHTTPISTPVFSCGSCEKQMPDLKLDSTERPERGNSFTCQRKLFPEPPTHDEGKGTAFEEEYELEECPQTPTRCGLNQEDCDIMTKELTEEEEYRQLQERETQGQFNPSPMLMMIPPQCLVNSGEEFSYDLGNGKLLLMKVVDL